MITAHRPFATAGVALLGAGVIAGSPALAPTSRELPHFAAPEITLQATIFDIFTFPAWQQSVANEVEFVAIRARGLAAGGTALAQSLGQLPATVGTAIQQVLNRDALGALTTIEEWIVSSTENTLIPPVLANIDVGQIQLAIQSALLLAQPTALIQLGSAAFAGADTVARALIIATQGLVDAVVSLNPAAIVQAVVTGVTGVLNSVAVAGQDVVDGIVAAQDTLATALAARPAPTPPSAASEPSAAPAALGSVTARATAGSDPAAQAAPVEAGESPADSADAGADQPTAPRQPAAAGRSAGAHAVAADTESADRSAATRRGAQKAAR
ncbi:MAG: hypothetical protein EBU23_05475 [Mycobacteriaceae bacterium]|nr:hypothetical protein [Mycobacterium sp.]NBQ42003.1 hypothetical protein [Mycobacteriaceae bacterium]